MSASILIVDDQQELLDLLSMSLTSEGYRVSTATSGAQALNIMKTHKPDLILLDVVLGDMNGIELTGKLKNIPETASVPIILLTAKDKETDIVVGLRMGADDYITKPFSTNVLVARIEAVLRRIRSDSLRDAEKEAIGNLRIVPDSRQLYLNGQPVEMTSSEFDILQALFEAGGQILSRSQLKEILSVDGHDQKERIVDVHIASIRKKLGLQRNLIKTVHGRGYRIKKSTV